MSANTSAVTPCFTPGTLIATDQGTRAVETLKRGDRVVTRDNGLRRIWWVGRRHVGHADLADIPELRPVLVMRDALGSGRPNRDMIVSPNHRFLIAKDQAPFEISGSEALIAVKHLMNGHSIKTVPMLGVGYLHLLCNQHQVLLANGAWTESFHPDDATFGGMANGQRLELKELFPEIDTIGASNRFPAAREILKNSRQV